MIDISVKPNDESKKDSEYKINKAFQSLHCYINDYKLDCCKSNISVISNTCSIENPARTTEIYAYKDGCCVPYGTITGKSFTPNNKRIINVRCEPVCVSKINNSCALEVLLYDYLESGAPGGVYTCGSGCAYLIPSWIYRSEIPNCEIWPCLGGQSCEWNTYYDRYCNPVQLSENVWAIVARTVYCVGMTGYPIVPLSGVTMCLEPCTIRCPSYGGAYGMPYSYKYEVPFGLPFIFIKGNSCIMDAFCPQFFCVDLNLRGTMTLLDFNKCCCGANVNNTLIASTPDIIPVALRAEASAWYEDYICNGYKSYVCRPWFMYHEPKYDEYFWRAITATFIRTGKMITYITINESTSCSGEDIAQILLS